MKVLERIMMYFVSEITLIIIYCTGSLVAIIFCIALFWQYHRTLIRKVTIKNLCDDVLCTV